MLHVRLPSLARRSYERARLLFRSSFEFPCTAVDFVLLCGFRAMLQNANWSVPLGGRTRPLADFLATSIVERKCITAVLTPLLDGFLIVPVSVWVSCSQSFRCLSCLLLTLVYKVFNEEQRVVALRDQMAGIKLLMHFSDFSVQKKSVYEGTSGTQAAG